LDTPIARTFSRLDQARHRRDRLADRRHAVGEVVVEQVDAVGAQPRQRPVDRGPDVGGSTPRAGRAVLHVDAELRRQDDPVTPAVQDLAQERLARARAPVDGVAGAVAVDVGRVQEGDPRGQGGIEHGPGCGQVEPGAEVVAAEADVRHLQRAEGNRLHGGRV
jgi:hypothetical protein